MEDEKLECEFTQKKEELWKKRDAEEEWKWREQEESEEAQKEQERREEQQNTAEAKLCNKKLAGEKAKTLATKK